MKFFTLEDAIEDYKKQKKEKQKNKKVKTKCSTCIYHARAHLYTGRPQSEAPMETLICKIKGEYIAWNRLEAIFCKYHQNNQKKDKKGE